MSVKDLVLQKDEAEQEIQELTAYLTAPGMPGLSGGLVDGEGYPLADVDKIIAVRQARHRLACTRAYVVCCIYVSRLWSCV
jgi:26S proteasome non-ATPase regulatory subunit 9